MPEPKICPTCRLLGDKLGRPGELPLRVVQQTDLELGQPAIEISSRLLVGWRLRRRQAAALEIPVQAASAERATTPKTAKTFPGRISSILFDIVTHRLGRGPYGDDRNEGHPNDV